MCAERNVRPRAPNGLSDTGVETDAMSAPGRLSRVVKFRIGFFQKAIEVSNLSLTLHAAICVCVFSQ